MFPPLGPRPASQGCSHLSRRDHRELPAELPGDEEELFQGAMEHFHEMLQESETRASADAQVQEDMDIEELAEGLLKRAHKEAHGATSSTEHTSSRRRIGPPPSVELKRKTLEVPEATSKVQRISAGFRTSNHP